MNKSKKIKFTTISVSERLKEKLKNLGKKGETYENIIEGIFKKINGQKKYDK